MTFCNFDLSNVGHGNRVSLNCSPEKDTVGHEAGNKHYLFALVLGNTCIAVLSVIRGSVQ